MNMKEPYILNEKEKEVLEMYQSLNFESNAICKACRSKTPNLSKPFPAWCVGNKFYTHDERILFVGKNARGDYDKSEFTFQFARDSVKNKNWAFWNYPKAISEKLFCDHSLEHIAITNIVKCNHSNKKDLTNNDTKKYCIHELKVIRKEIVLINPTHIVFFTNKDYDDYMNSIFDKYEITCDTIVKIGKKQMPWLEANGMLNDQRIKILRIGHPERKEKDEYVSLIYNWIRDKNKEKCC